MGYRREYQVEARGELAVRGSIVDVYPSTADHPVRIDLWGDEVDRLSQFSVADQRSHGDLAEMWLFPVRELLPTDDVRARAAELLQTDPWGREQWERLADGQTFDGMESWLPWLTAEEHLLSDLLPASALVAIVEPRRLRDRAQELLDEEVALGVVARGHVGCGGSGRRRRDCRSRSTGCSRTRGAGTCSCSPARPSRHAGARRERVRPGRRRRRRAGRADQRAACRRIPRARRGRRHRLGRPHRADLARGVASTDGRCARAGTSWSRRSIGARCCPARISRSSPKPTSPAAGASTARRAARGAGRTTTKGSPRVTSSCTACTASAGTSAWRRARCSASRATGSSSSSRAATASTSTPRTSDSSASTPVARSRGCRRWAAPTGRRRAAGVRTRRARHRGRARHPLPQAPRDARPRVRGRHAVPAADRGRVPVRGDARPAKAIAETKADMERPIPMDRLICGDVGYGKTEVALRAAAKAVFDGTQVAVLVPTTLLASQHGQTFRERFANYPVRVEVLSGSSPRRSRPKSSRACRRARSTSSSGRTACSPKTSSSRTSGCSSWTRSSVSVCSTRNASRRCGPTWTC